MKENRKGLVIAIIVLLVGAGVIPSISGDIETDRKETNGEKGTAVIGNPISMDSIIGIEENVPIFDGDITVVSIQPPAQEVEKGEEFTAGIYVEPSEPITDVGIDIIYFDPTLIQADRVDAVWDLFDWLPVPGGQPPGFDPGIIDNINGKISYIIGGWGVASDPGYFCNITFTAQQKPGTSPLDIQNVLIRNINHDLLPSTVIDGEVTVGKEPVTIHEFVPPVPNGENGWYVSDVIIILEATDEQSGVEFTYYKLDTDDEYEEYNAPVTVSEDGEYELYYYSVDYAENKEDDKGPFDFKIDQTRPTIDLEVESLGGNEWNLIAIVSDAMSGIDRVEFYLNDILLGNVTEEPYEWQVSEQGMAKAIVYDNAGNKASDEDEVSVSYRQSQSNSNLVPVQRCSF